jgi:hypothetical protein
MSAKAILLLTNNTAKKVLRRIRTPEELTSYEKKWRFKLITHQGMLVFNSIEAREKFLNHKW